MDGGEHLRIRRIVAAAFTPRRIEQWKPVIAAVAAGLLDGLEKSGPPADLAGGTAASCRCRSSAG